MSPGEGQGALELKLEIPDETLADRAGRLVGFDARFRRLGAQLRLLADADGLRAWARRYHDGAPGLIGAIADRYPLAIFHVTLALVRPRALKQQRTVLPECSVPMVSY
jgi:hypothetical protein